MKPLTYYHHPWSSYEVILVRLLDKVLQSGERAVIMAPNEEVLKFIDSYLWTFSKTTVLPHGHAEDGNAPYQPIWITLREENPNNASIFIALEDVNPSPSLELFKRGIILRSKLTPKDKDYISTCPVAPVLWKEKKEGGWERASI